MVNMKKMLVLKDKKRSNRVPATYSSHVDSIGKLCCSRQLFFVNGLEL